MIKEIPLDIENIIMKYKKDFENYDNNCKIIEKQIEIMTKTDNYKYKLYHEPIKVNIYFENFKEILYKFNIKNIVCRINNEMKKINIYNDEDFLLDNFIVEEVIYSYKLDYLFLDLK